MKGTMIRRGLEELKFLKSPNDLKFFYAKLSYLLPRVIGTFARHTNVPPSLQIEPTNHCNLNCICCPTLASTREKGYMDFDLFRRIIDDASQIGVKRVHLYLHGESLLHPKIVDMIGYVKSKAIGFHLTTNGTLFNKQKIEAILRSGVNSADHIIFSILGYSKKVHEKTMKGVDHDKVLENTTVSSGQKVDEFAKDTITAKNNYLIQNGGEGNFTAGDKITLDPGFTSDTGSEFSAEIQPALTYWDGGGGEVVSRERWRRRRRRRNKERRTSRKCKN